MRVSARHLEDPMKDQKWEPPFRSHSPHACMETPVNASKRSQLTVKTMRASPRTFPLSVVSNPDPVPYPESVAVVVTMWTTGPVETWVSFGFANCADAPVRRATPDIDIEVWSASTPRPRYELRKLSL